MKKLRREYITLRGVKFRMKTVTYGTTVDK